MAFVIVNRNHDAQTDELVVTFVYGPYETREEAQSANEEFFPTPEFNVIVRVAGPSTW